MLKYLQNRGYIMTFGIVLGLSVASFLFAFNAKATINPFITQLYTDTEGGAQGLIQTFTMPEDQYISGVEFYGNENDTYLITLCSGTGLASGTPATARSCDYGNHTLIATSTCIVSAGTSTRCNLPFSHPAYQGQSYYFVIDYGAGNTTSGFMAEDTVYSEGELFFIETGASIITKWGNPSYWSYSPDLKFRIYYDDSITPSHLLNEGTIGNNGLSETCPDLYLLDSTCFMGEDCDIEYMYNDLFVEAGGTVTVSYFGTPIEWLSDRPEKNLYNEAKITIGWEFLEDTISTGTVWYLCFEVNVDETDPNCNYGFSTWRECEFKVTWYDKEAYEAEFNAEMDEIFADYASTSPDQCYDLCDEETGMIACGLKKAGCWAFAPSIKSQQKFVDSLLLFEKQFPYSVVNQILTLFSTTTTSFETTSTPLTINWTTFGLPRDETLTILSENMMSDTWGETWDTIYDMQEKIIYFFFLLFMIYFVFKSGFGADISSLFRKTPTEPTNKKDYTIDLRSHSYGSSHGTEIINLRK